MSEPVAVRALKAPRRSGEAIVDPPLDAVGRLLERNRALPLADVELLGRSLAELARLARRQLLDDALRYSRQYRDVPPLANHWRSQCRADAEALPRILVAGHQPELFHPGVWFKNFVLDGLARRHGALAVNLIVDHDTCRQASIRVPTGTTERPSVERVAFDAGTSIVPWEDRGVSDADLFRSFGQRARALLRPLVEEPVLTELWPLAVAAADRGASLGMAIAEARHAYEARLGLETLELPTSAVCRSEAFAWFAAWLITEAPRVREVYNRAVRSYRRANRVRSVSHPVPDLAQDGEFCESPLWVWSRADPRRRHLFVARRRGGVTLTDREGWTCEIPAPDVGSPEAAAERLLALDCEGVRLRPRALVMTWYARMMLCDLFVHGIGGAKYDEVTDRIIAELFGIDPPAYLTASATLHLPVAHDTDARERLAALKKRRRDLLYHAEKATTGGDKPWREAVRAKQACIDEFRRAAVLPWQREAARRRHHAVAAANAALSPWAEGELRSLEREESRLAEQVRAAQLLESREYAFCLFPREAIVPTLAALAGAAPVT